MTRDNSRYIRKSPTGEYFDIQAYEDNEQMKYLSGLKKTNREKKSSCSSKLSSFISRLKSVKTR